MASLAAEHQPLLSGWTHRQPEKTYCGGTVDSPQTAVAEHALASIPLPPGYPHRVFGHLEHSRLVRVLRAMMPAVEAPHR